MRPDALTGLLGEITAGVFRVEELKPSDYERVADLLERYIDLRVGPPEVRWGRSSMRGAAA